MENSTKNTDSVENRKRNRSLNRKSLYKSRVSELVETEKEVPQKLGENDKKNIKKKKGKSRKEVSSSAIESESSKSRKESGNGVKFEPDSSQKLTGGNKLLHGISLPLGDTNAFNIPKRPRGPTRRKKLVGDQVSEPLELTKSVEPSKSINSEVDKCEEPDGPAGQLVNLIKISESNDVISNPKSASNGTTSNSKSKRKRKRKAVDDEAKKSNSDRSGSVRHAEKEDNLVLNDGNNTSSKKRRNRNRKKKDLVTDNPEPLVSNSALDDLPTDLLDNDDEKNLEQNTSSNKRRTRNRKKKDLVTKNPEPLVSNSALDDLTTGLVDDDDEENLEQNAARMLSSRFDTSFTRFSPKKTPSGVHTPGALVRDPFGSEANQSDLLESASADDTSRALRPRRNDKGVFGSRKRRHFYEILPKDLDAYWVLKKKIKVFWPLEDSWFHGVVNDYHSVTKLHHVKYDDRDEEWIDLREEKFKILLYPSEFPSKEKRKRVSKDVHKSKKAKAPHGDDENILDSEPISSWLARSSQRAVSSSEPLEKRRTLQMHPPTDNSERRRDKPEIESTSEDDSTVHRKVDKSPIKTGSSSKNSKKIFYVRKRRQKRSEGSCSVSRDIESTQVTIKPLVFRISFPIAKGWYKFSVGSEYSWLLRAIFMLQHGCLVTSSPAVILEILLVDTYHGLRFVLLEGCLKQALTFLFSIMILFGESVEGWNEGGKVPVTTVRLRLSSGQDMRKQHVFSFYSFSRLRSSKWLYLDSKVLRKCLFVKELAVSEFTYDNIKELEGGKGLHKKSGLGILPRGISSEANSRMNYSRPGKVFPYALPFSAAPNLFLTLHLQLLMEKSLTLVNLQHHDARNTPVISENVTRRVAENPPRFKPISGDLILDIPSQIDTPTGSRVSLKHVRDISIYSPGQNTISHGFSNGPKKPRTQVQYTLPSADVSTKQKTTQNQRVVVPCKRIRKASLKKIPEGTTRRNWESLACSANVLVNQEVKGWRECGARVFLEEVAENNESRLVVKLSEVTKYSVKVKDISQPGSTNRYTHAMMWKGGKDWALEFPDRSQWTLFKEMYEECYNRNVRAAYVKHIPIPGVKLLLKEGNDITIGPPLVPNPSHYLRQVQSDVEMAMDPSRVLYDMDSDDERWLMEKEVSEVVFEKTMDLFEKVSYVQNRFNFGDAEVEELVSGIMLSVDAAKGVYEHWREKRERKGMPLVRHFQPPLWEWYQQKLKDWELTISRSNRSFSIGGKEKLPLPEKPPVNAFCLKPRGLDVPNKGSKQRAHRKLQDGHFALGRRSNGLHFGDDKTLFATNVQESSDFSPSLRTSKRVFSPRDASELNPYSKVYKNTSKKLKSHPSFNNRRTRGYNTGAGRRKVNSPEFSNQKHFIGSERSDGPDLHEIRLLNASSVARHALHVAKFKREKAHILHCKADIAVHRAAVSLMTAEAIKGAHENSYCSN